MTSGTADDEDAAASRTSTETTEHPEPPEPPETVPQYLVDGVRRQNFDALEDLGGWIDEVLEHRRRREMEAEEVVGDDEKLVETLSGEDVDVGTGGGEPGTVVLKEIPCGKGCGGCPHGPYAYRAYWRDGATRTEYLGRADDVLRG